MKQIRQRESNKDLISINIRNIGILPQVRSAYDDSKIGELALSIKNNTIRSPITLYPADEDSKQKAIDYMSKLPYFAGFEHHEITHIVKIGHTRYLAHVKLTLSGEQGFESIDAFEDFRGDDKQLVSSQLAENLIRGELSAQDIRMAIKRLHDVGLSNNEICKRIFKDKGYVSQNLSALNVVNNVVNHVNNSDEYAYSQMGEFINKTIFAMSTTSLYTIREVEPREIVKFISQEIESYGNLADFNITLSNVKSFLKNRAKDKSVIQSDTNQPQSGEFNDEKLSSSTSDINLSNTNQPQNQEFQGNPSDENQSEKMQLQLPAGVKLQKIICPACEMEISVYVDVDGIVRVVNHDE